MSENKETFSYTYSASQQKEIEAIKRKYTTDKAPVEADKMAELRRIDASVTNKASVTALCVGVVFVLIMGLGMSLIMTDLGKGLGASNSLLIGIAVGVIGMAGVISAYPLHRHVLKKERRKAAPQVLKLTEELSQK